MRDAAALILLQMDKATKIGDLADGPMTIVDIAATTSEQDEVFDEDDNIGIFAIGGIDDDGQ